MKRIALAILATMLSACASIESTRTTGDDVEGLYYYMPKKDFLITVTVKSGAPTKVAFGESAAYPDLQTKYVLQYAHNPIGKNTVDIGVNEKGLLTSAKSDNVSGLSDALKSLASVAGSVTALASFAAEAPKPCPDGDHVFVMSPSRAGTTRDVCGIHVEIKRLPAPAAGVSAVSPVMSATSSPGSTATAATMVVTRAAGVFYRQDEPYIVLASGDGLGNEAILFSPNESPPHFLPISRTLFGANHAELTLTNGMPTKYKQDVDGELVALAKLPADLLSAYFAAIGAMFTTAKNNAQGEAAALDATTKLELARVKYAACLAAIQGKADADTITKLGCNGQ